jgi:Uma2 family endonuclease
MLVIELLSPHDESRAKFAFYAQASIREIWLMDPETREHQVHSLVDDRYVQIEPIDGATCSPVLGIELTIVAGKLRLRDGDYVADV